MSFDANRMINKKPTPQVIKFPNNTESANNNSSNADKRFADTKMRKLIQKAADAMNKGDLKSGKQYCRKILKSNKKNFDALQMLGLIYQHESNWKNAKRQYEKSLLAFDPEYIKPSSYIKVLLNLGQCAEQLDSFEEAMEFYDAVIALDMTNTVALARRGRLFMERGFLQESLENYKQVIYFPDREEYRHLGLRFNAHVAIMQSTHIPPEEHDIEYLKRDIEKMSGGQHKVKCEFALANGLEKLKHFDDAWKAYVRANDQKRKVVSYIRKNSTMQNMTMIKNFTSELYEKLKTGGDPDFSPIFVLGLPRSGTTVTESILGAHPDVNAAGELPYISDIAIKLSKKAKDQALPNALEVLTPKDMTAMANYYKSHTQEHLNGGTTFVDKMPGNFWNIGIILSIFPNARIIHLYKNPLDACISLFKQHFAMGHEYCYNLGDLGHYYAEFRRNVAHWKSLFGDKIYDLSYEDFVTNIDTRAPELFEFCGLEWDEKYLDFHKSHRRVKTASVQQVRKGIYTTAVERWRSYDIGDNLYILKKALKPFFSKEMQQEVAELIKLKEANTQELKQSADHHLDVNTARPTKAKDSEAKGQQQRKNRSESNKITNSPVL